MDPESKKMLEESLALSKENNQMLHSMRRSARIGAIVRTIYWLFIIGSAVGAYYLLQPYLNQLISIYGDASGVLKGFKQ